MNGLPKFLREPCGSPYDFLFIFNSNLNANYHILWSFFKCADMILFQSALYAGLSISGLVGGGGGSAWERRSHIRN